MKGYEREISLLKEVYLSDRYFSYSQLWSFVEQIYYIKKINSTNIVEIGKGNGFVSDILKSAGDNVTTIDINPKLNPDIVANIQDVDKFIHPGEYDLISCCEVLEHLPFYEFEKSIRMFSNNCNKLFLTLPMYNKYFGFGGYIKFINNSTWRGIWIKLPFSGKKLPDEHYWEINYSKETKKKNIIQILKKYYKIIDTGLFKANPYHRYFICTK
jgi:hypothetical protein